MFEQLLAEDSFRSCKTVVDSVQGCDAESPVEMIGLHRVGLALDVEHFLVWLDRVGFLRVRRGQIRVPGFVRRAHVEPDNRPAIDLNAALFPSVPMRAAPDRLHQRA